jgi:hypothetical protein
MPADKPREFHVVKIAEDLPMSKPEDMEFFTTLIADKD